MRVRTGQERSCRALNSLEINEKRIVFSKAYSLGKKN